MAKWAVDFFTISAYCLVGFVCLMIVCAIIAPRASDQTKTPVVTNQDLLDAFNSSARSNPRKLAEGVVKYLLDQHCQPFLDFNRCNHLFKKQIPHIRSVDEMTDTQVLAYLDHVRDNVLFMIRREEMDRHPEKPNQNRSSHLGGINMAPKDSGLTTLMNDPDKSKIYVDPTALMEGTMGKDLDGDGRIGF